MSELEKNHDQIEKSFRQLFYHPTRLSWDTEENNTVRAENYDIKENVTSITICDIPTGYVDK